MFRGIFVQNCFSLVHVRLGFERKTIKLPGLISPASPRFCHLHRVPPRGISGPGNVFCLGNYCTRALHPDRPPYFCTLSVSGLCLSSQVISESRFFPPRAQPLMCAERRSLRRTVHKRAIPNG